MSINFKAGVVAHGRPHRKRSTLEALHLSIAYGGREVMIISTVRPHGGFNHLPEQAVRCLPHPQAVGEARLGALRHCP
jgi:hypothetical protein